MSIDLTAQEYIDLGWKVVPLNPGEKRASSAWPKTTYTAAHFNPDSNIAVKLGNPSGWLIDVDCDHAFAVAAAKQLLPTTGRVFGRSSKPASHYLFYATDAPSKQFSDVNGGMLVEIRSTGGYTMFPPS